MRKRFRKTVFIIVFTLATTLSVTTGIKAETKVVQQDGNDIVDDDPQRGREQGYIIENNGKAYIESKEYQAGKYVHNSKFSDATVKNGIDVSVYQGAIDWSAVKNSGQVDFAFIRAGYRGYGSSGTLAIDKNYVTNIKGANSAGVPVGVYFFSQATSVDEAKEEAEYVVSLISGYDITMPVVFDFEYASDSTGNIGRLYNAKLSKSVQTGICKAFCEVIGNAGYTPMIYANKSMLETGLNASELSKNYFIWLANYTTQTSYSGDYTYWQYTDKGSVSGISGDVDLDFWYDMGTVYKGVDYSAVYNADYYLTKYPDIQVAFQGNAEKALEHFVLYGMNEGRQGNATFNVKAYKSNNKDLRLAFGSDWKSYYLHYNTYGKNEGRVCTGNEKITDGITVYKGVDYANVYDYNYYISANPDIAAAFPNDDLSAIEHFVSYGMGEGRQASSEFNLISYRNRYSDLRVAFGSDWKSYYLHYNNYGKLEGRQATGEVVLVGITVYNGVDYSEIYDYNYYISTYPDIKAAFGGDELATLEHFVKYGMDEARQGKNTFNVFIYCNRYEDLQNAFGENWKLYYLHYMNYGKNEGRCAQ